MANIYVRSTDGNNADNGSTWALAKATLAGAAAIAVAGDTIWLSQVHAETVGGNISLQGTKSSPIRVLCGNDGAEPPTAAALTAAITTATTATVNIATGATPGHQYIYGLVVNSGSGASSNTMIIGSSGHWEFERCVFRTVATGTGGLQAGSITSGNQLTRLKNCTVKFGANSQSITFTGNGNQQFHWQGGSIEAGSSSPNTANNGVFTQGTVGAIVGLIEDVDFSVLASGAHLFNGTTSLSSGVTFVIRNCKLPASWSGSLVRQTPLGIGRYSLYNCSAGSQNYKLWIECAEGTIRDETTIVRTNGAMDGVTPLSWKLTSVANANYPANALVTDDIMFYVAATGLSTTATLHFIHDSATNLTDQDIWVEFSSLEDSGTPLGTFKNDAAVDVLTTAVDQAASLAVWNTTGLATPNKQQVSVTFIPRMAGFIIARVRLAKASKTVYVCPKIDLS